MVQCREELRFALEAGQPIGIAGEEVGQDLERDVAPEPRVAGAKHLAHAPGAELADDLIRAQFRAGSQGHVVGGNSTGSGFTRFTGSRGSREVERRRGIDSETYHCHNARVPPDLDIKELCDGAGVTPRTVHYYIQQGLLPGAGTTGSGARYSPDHLDGLRPIRLLQNEHLPLPEQPAG